MLCSTVAAELYHGAENSQNPAIELARVEGFVQSFHVHSFDVAAAREYGRVRADLEQRGLPIGDNDTQIVAIARVHNLVVVTHNTSQFSRIPSLMIEDWELP